MAKFSISLDQTVVSAVLVCRKHNGIGGMVVKRHCSSSVQQTLAYTKDAMYDASAANRKPVTRHGLYLPDIGQRSVRQ
jgi:hypothetical protein